jgi:dUTPase
MHHVLKVKVLDDRLGRDFPLPAYATDGAAGLEIVGEHAPSGRGSGGFGHSGRL